MILVMSMGASKDWKERTLSQRPKTNTAKKTRHKIVDLTVLNLQNNVCICVHNVSNNLIVLISFGGYTYICIDEFDPVSLNYHCFIFFLEFICVIHSVTVP